MIEQTQGSMESVCLVIHSLIVYLALVVQRMDNAIHRISKYSCMKMRNLQTTLNFKLKPPTQY